MGLFDYGSELVLLMARLRTDNNEFKMYQFLTMTRLFEVWHLVIYKDRPIVYRQ